MTNLFIVTFKDDRKRIKADIEDFEEINEIFQQVQQGRYEGLNTLLKIGGVTEDDVHSMELFRDKGNGHLEYQRIRPGH